MDLRRSRVGGRSTSSSGCVRCSVSSGFQWAGVALVPVAGAMRERLIMDMFHDPDRLPHQNYRSAVDEALLSLRQPSWRLALLAAARGLVTDRHTGPCGYWNRLADGVHSR